MSVETRRTHEIAGLVLLGELVESLVSGAPVEETVSLVCQTIRRVAGFRFCGVLVPDATWTSFRLAGGHGFPPEYVDRLNELFLVPVGEQQRDSPTRQAAEKRRTVVNSDVHSASEFAPWRALAQRFGYRSMVSVPLIVDGELIGVFNGYSSEQRDFTPDELASIETLSAQAAISLRVSTLMEAHRETIAHLESANETLERQHDTLQRAHEIHQKLTAAALTGSDPQRIVGMLSELIDSPVFIERADGTVEAESAEGTALALRHRPQHTIVGEIRIPGEMLGHVTTLAGADADYDLRQRAVEHAATVLALEAVKERVVHATQDRLQAGFIADLVRGRHDDDPDVAARALRHGLNLERSYRVVIARVGGEVEGGEVALRVRRELSRVPDAVVIGTGSNLTALVPDQSSDALAERIERIRSQLGPSGSVTAGIGAQAMGVRDFAVSRGGAELCLDLAQRLGRANVTLVRDELGLLAFFVDTRNPGELLGNTQRVLGPVIEHDRLRGGALVQTLTEYLESGCDISVASAKLFVHPNTVKYRLRQAQDMCGFDLRNPDDLLQARIATLTLQLL